MNQTQETTIDEGFARGLNHREIARLAGCSTKSVDRRAADPKRKKIREALRHQMLDSTGGKLAEYSARAADRLNNLLDSESEMIQLQASRAILEYCVRVRDQVTLEARITALEEAGAQPVIGRTGRT